MSLVCTSTVPVLRTVYDATPDLILLYRFELVVDNSMDNRVCSQFYLFSSLCAMPYSFSLHTGSTNMYTTLYMVYEFELLVYRLFYAAISDFKQISNR